jgi:DNA-binding transcriptional MerR regulator
MDDGAVSRSHSVDAFLSAQMEPGPLGDQTIAQTAQSFGLTSRALRFYESKGLLAPRRRGLVRLYGPSERRRLALILKAKSLGFTLGEIRKMLEDPPGGDCALGLSRRQCYEQIKHLEQRRREIDAALAELRRTYSSFYVRLFGSPPGAADQRDAP